MYGEVFVATHDTGMWMPAPSAELDISRSGFSDSLQLENGGYGLRSSKAYSTAYQMSWVGQQFQVEPWENLAEGYYGDGFIYYQQPEARITNILPANWATPGLARQDWPAIVKDANAVKVAPGGALGLPSHALAVSPDSKPGANDPVTEPAVFIPVDGQRQVLWYYIVANNISQNAKILMEEHLSDQTISRTTVTINTVNTSPSDSNIDWNQYSLNNNTYGVSMSLCDGDATIYGMGVTVWDTGNNFGSFAFDANRLGSRHRKGRGCTGMLFEEMPSSNLYSAAIGESGLVSVSATLRETEQWLR